MSRQRFEFLVPIEKASVGDNGDVMIDGPVTSENEDLQDERVITKDVYDALDAYMRLGMPIDYDHRSVRSDNPDEPGVKWIIGHGVELHDGPSKSGGTCPHLRGVLYKSKPATQECLEHIAAGGKLYYSIGGTAIRKNGVARPRKITHVAVTPYPANPDCQIGLVGLAKSLAAGDAAGEEEPGALDSLRAGLNEVLALVKTLAAGSGPGQDSTGGRALIPEDMEQPKRRPRGADDPESHNSSETDTERDDKHDDPPVPRSAGRRETPRKHRGGARTMGKSAAVDAEVMDQATLDELQALEGDKAMGPIAKAIGALADRVGTLLKGRRTRDEDEDDDDTDEDDDRDDDEDDDEDDRDRSRGRVAKSVASEPIGGEEDFISPDEFRRQLNRDLSKSFRKIIQEEVKPLAARLEAMEKSLQGSTEKSDELLKSLDEIGKRPRPNAASFTVVNGPNGTALSRRDIVEALKKGLIQGKVTPADIANFETSGQYNANLVKSLIS